MTLREGTSAERPSITLVKTSRIYGVAPLGETFTVKGRPGMDHDELVAYAHRCLQRARPDENPRAWSERWELETAADEGEGWPPEPGAGLEGTGEDRWAVAE